jgi:hypothetical protein
VNVDVLMPRYDGVDAVTLVNDIVMMLHVGARAVFKWLNVDLVGLVC